MGSHEANIVVSKIRGFIQAVLTTPSGPGVLGLERLGAIYQNAIEYHEKALAIDRESLGESHPAVASHYNNLGAAWQSLGQYQKAIEYYEKALAILRGALPKGHADIRNTERNLAAAKRQQ